MQFIFTSGWFISMNPDEMVLPQGPNMQQVDETYHHRLPEDKLVYGKGLVCAQTVNIITNDNKWKKIGTYKKTFVERLIDYNCIETVTSFLEDKEII